MDISVADRDGYSSGVVTFKVGVGNKIGFDRLDAREEERLLRRIVERGPFQTLDLTFNISYSIRDGRKHNVRGDQYLARMLFSPERAGLLLHHLKGLRRVQPDELIQILTSTINTELAREGYKEVEVESQALLKGSRSQSS